MPVKVGGTGVYLMPDYLVGAEIGYSMNGILQRINPQATRSTIGCPKKCKFCGVPKTEGVFIELEDWPDLPIYCDNNILASSKKHFDRIMDRLEAHGWGDFNQGVDARLLTKYHAERIGRVKKLIVRLALDHQRDKKAWEKAFAKLRESKVAKTRIRSYVMVGFDTGVDEAWERCHWVESFGIKPLPMWFHPLDTLKKNEVTLEQMSLGWTDYERRKMMQWFYQHKRAVLPCKSNR
jgi:hypothetical protein